MHYFFSWIPPFFLCPISGAGRKVRIEGAEGAEGSESGHCPLWQLVLHDRWVRLAQQSFHHLPLSFLTTLSSVDYLHMQLVKRKNVNNHH